MNETEFENGDVVVAPVSGQRVITTVITDTGTDVYVRHPEGPVSIPREDVEHLSEETVKEFFGD